MTHTPIDSSLVKNAINELNISNLSKATIREIVSLTNAIELASGCEFIRMEMGVPGLPQPEVGTLAEIEALKNGVASKYPMLDGLPELKAEASKFVKNFMNIQINAKGCIPTVGTMQASYAVFMLANHLDKTRDTALVIDPGFPAQKLQLKVLGQKFVNFDVFKYRGNKLRDKLEQMVCDGNINSLVYSNPNNPSWICFTPDELQTIGEIANKYDVLVIEDLAYFGMDFRCDISKPGQPPYQATVAHYTNNYVLLISSSKSFSNAGQRIGLLCVSDALFNRNYPNLADRFGVSNLGYVLVQRLIYAMSSGVCHSAQYGLAAMLKAANQDSFNFIESVKEYGEKAAILKRIFIENSFHLVYDKDIDSVLADGFYFTVAYKNMIGAELIENLMCYGISTLSLAICGSDQINGVRICVSQIGRNQFQLFEHRIKQFNSNFSVA